MKRYHIINKTRGAWKVLALGLASAAFLAGNVSAQVTIPAGTTTTTTDIPPAGFWSSGAITFEENSTLFSNPSAQNPPPTGYTINNALIFDGAAGGYITLQFDDNDTKWAFTGPITSTAAGSQTLSIMAGIGSNGGDREDVLFATPIPDSGVGQPLSVSVTFQSQSGANTYVNLAAANVFTGDITTTIGAQAGTHGYLVIGGERYEKAFDATRYTVPGSGSLNSGNYAGNITLGSQTILDFNTSANQALSGVISGVGQIVKEVSGTLTLSNLNTYTGSTTVSGGSLVVADTGGLSFIVTDGGANKVTGAGAATFNGKFTIDTSAVTVPLGSWTLADVTTKSFGSTFSVSDSVGGPYSGPVGGVWTYVNGTQTWTFNQATGVLSLSAPARITAFGIPGYPAVIDQNALAITLTVPYSPWGTALATLNPTFTLSSGTCNQTSGSPPSPTFAAQNPTTYTATAGAIVNNYIVLVVVMPASTANVLSNVFFPGLGYALPNDNTGTNLVIVVPPATVLTALSPTYNVSALATSTPASGTARDFTTPKTYTVTAESGAQQAYSVTVVPLAGYVGYQAMVLASGPVHYWPLNEISGTTAADIVGGNNATYGGTYTLGSPGLKVGPATSVRFTAVTGTGAGQWTGLPYNASLNPAQFTVEFWTQPIDTTVQYLVSLQDRNNYGGGAGRAGYAIWKNNGSAGFGMQVGTGATTTASINDPNAALPGISHHVAGTYDGATIQLYVDGILAASTAVPVYQPAGASQPGFGIASRNGNTAAPSYIQDVALYNRALSAQEIQTHAKNPPVMRITELAGGKQQLIWFPGGGTLEESPLVNGTYLPVASPTWPYTNTPTLGKDFWRVAP